MDQAASNIHWRSPTIMITALLGAAVFATAHHCFYGHLRDTQVLTGNYSVAGYDLGFSEQQTNTTVGTAFAFAVRTCLVLAVSTAYVQLFWGRLITRKPTKAFSLKSIDKAHSALRNPTLLMDFSGWKQFPILFVLALTTLLLPIASILTPGTLSVEARSLSEPRKTSTYVPVLDFSTLGFVAPMISLPYGTAKKTPHYFDYSGPSQALQRIAIAVSVQGAVLPIGPPSSNASWTSSFYGPTLRCDPVSDSEQIEIHNNIADYYQGEDRCFGRANGYLTWLGRLPYAAPPGGTVLEYNNNTLTPSDDTALQFRVSVLPNVLADIRMPTHTSCPLCFVYAAESLVWANGTTLQCSLYNSSYTAEFVYVNGGQSVTISVPKTEVEQLVTSHGSVTGPTNETCVGLNDSRFKSELCTFDPILSKELSYQAVMDAFYGVVGGSISIKSSTGNIAKSTLINTKELAYLSDYERHSRTDYTDLQSALGSWVRDKITGWVNYDAEQQRLPLAQAMEEMFQNLTVSLMSSPLFQPDLSDPKTLPLTQVLSYDYHNVYIYASRKLWLAYGIAIAFATAIVALGSFAIVRNRASYSSDFSTILRTSRNADLDHEVEESDRTGHDPLPSYLQKTTVVFLLSPDADKETATANNDDFRSARLDAEVESDHQLLPLENRSSTCHEPRSSTW